MINTEIDLLDQSFVTDPYPLYAELRQNFPVCPLKGGGYLITRHADILEAMANPDFQNGPSRFSVLHPSKIDRYVSTRLANNILPFQDAPIHTVHRRQVLAGFNPCARHLVTQLPQIAQNVLANINTGEDFDIISDFGRPYSIAAMAELLGLAQDDAIELAVGANAFFYLFTPIQDAQTFAAVEESLASLRSTFCKIVERQQAEKGDYFSNKFDHKAGSTPPDIALIADNMILLFADGIENIQYAIGCIWSMIAEQEDLLEKINQDDGNLRKIVKELIRLHTPAQSVPRIAKCDIHLHDTLIKRGMPIHLSIGSANRDETIFPDPDKIIIDGEGNRERAISFGVGKHSCIGGNLATEMLISAAQILHNQHIKPLYPSKDLSFIPRFAHRWPESVMARAN